MDLIDKGIEVSRASKGQRLRTGFEKVVGEAGGAAIGDILVGLAIPEALGTSLLVAPAVTVGHFSSRRICI